MSIFNILNLTLATFQPIGGPIEGEQQTLRRLQKFLFFGSRGGGGKRPLDPPVNTHASLEIKQQTESFLLLVTGRKEVIQFNGNQFLYLWPSH